jgi:BirA family transcriptional regulator, biotin operon repressor / biotin---[acetyl-CoA-carboxylase] ligase
VSTGHDALDAYLDGPSTWTRFVHLEEVDSTNLEVARRVRDGGPAGMVVVADHQTAGRGRNGRSWQDVPGGNLSISVATGIPATGATLVPLAAGLAAGDALSRAGVRALLKWPNDLLVRGDDGVIRKVGGILADAHDLRPSGPAFLVVGIGIDLDWRAHDRTGEEAGWTSIAEETGRDVDRWQVVHDLLRALETWMLDVPRDPTRLLASYTVRCTTLEQIVRVATPGGTVEGEAVRIDDSGGLVVRTDLGEQVVMAGDVEHLHPA